MWLNLVINQRDVVKFAEVEVYRRHHLYTFMDATFSDFSKYIL